MFFQQQLFLLLLVLALSLSHASRENATLIRKLPTELINRVSSFLDWSSQPAFSTYLNEIKARSSDVEALAAIEIACPYNGNKFPVIELRHSFVNYVHCWRAINSSRHLLKPRSFNYNDNEKPAGVYVREFESFWNFRVDPRAVEIKSYLGNLVVSIMGNLKDGVIIGKQQNVSFVFTKHALIDNFKDALESIFATPNNLLRELNLYVYGEMRTRDLIIPPPIQSPHIMDDVIPLLLSPNSRVRDLSITQHFGAVFPLRHVHSILRIQHLKQLTFSHLTFYEPLSDDLMRNLTYQNTSKLSSLTILNCNMDGIHDVVIWQLLRLLATSLNGLEVLKWTPFPESSVGTLLQIFKEPTNFVALRRLILERQKERGQYQFLELFKILLDRSRQQQKIHLQAQFKHSSNKEVTIDDLCLKDWSFINSRDIESIISLYQAADSHLFDHFRSLELPSCQPGLVCLYQLLDALAANTGPYCKLERLSLPITQILPPNFMELTKDLAKTINETSCPIREIDLRGFFTLTTRTVYIQGVKITT